MNLTTYITEITKFCQNQVKIANAKGLVIGLSGGIDSAVVALIAQKAINKNHLCVIMPCDSESIDQKCALELVQKHKLNHVVIDLTSTYQQLINQIDHSIFDNTETKIQKIILGNLKARLRMATLYFFAQMKNYLVAGTDNADEWYTGYFTKYGDGGADFLPIVKLLKQEVVAAAKLLGVPEIIIARKPSAGLWIDQTDEAEMQFSYQELDNFLLNKTNLLSNETLQRIKNLHQQSEHKRQPLPQAPDWERSNN